MAIINIKTFGKVVVPDLQARQIKKDWTEMKQGLFPKETIIEVGEFTGSLGDITGFMIDDKKEYKTGLQEGEYKHDPETHARMDKEIKSIGQWLKGL